MPDNAAGSINHERGVSDEPSSSYSPKYFFVELTSLDDLSFPGVVSRRIKFTCLTSSTRHLVLGTSSGTGYVFARFRQKSRLAPAGSVPMAPLEVFVTKDGPISCLSMSSSEQMVAVGSDSGRVSVTSMNASNQQSSIIYTVPGNPQKPDKVTSLLWSEDCKFLYAGHASGTVNMHKITVRSMFRSSFDLLSSFDGAVTQMSIMGSLLLISTSVASHIYDLEQSTATTIGTKARNSKMGACFVKSDPSSAEGNVPTTGCDFVLAARPNGRMWEANTAGVVYRTHQFRQSPRIPRSHVVSFRTTFNGDQGNEDENSLESAANMDVNLQNLHTINIEGNILVVTWYKSHLLLLEVDSSRVVVLTNLEEEIIDISVTGTDIFLLTAGKHSLRKFCVLNPKQTISKLEQRDYYSQCGQVILYSSKDVLWDASTVMKIAEALGSQSSGKRKRNLDNEKIRIALYELLESQHNFSQSQYDNVGVTEVKSSVHKLSFAVPLPSGIHQVVTNSSEKDDEDGDFVFHLPSPLREKSRSSPCVEARSLPSLTSTFTSMPVTSLELTDCSFNGAADVTREDILVRARTILENNGQTVENDSLRFLLQLECATEDVKFVPTVTVGNAARSLAELAMSSPVDLTAMFAIKQKPTMCRRGPTIVKPVRPIVKHIPATTHAPSPAVPTETNSNVITNEIPDLPTNIPAPEPLNNEANERERNIIEDDWLERQLRTISVQKGETVENRLSSIASSESGSNTTTSVMTAEAKEEAAPPGEHCTQCWLHRSWLAVSLLSAVCQKVQVLETTYSQGGVPSNIEQWTDLFERKFNDSNIGSETNLCPGCETGLAVAFKPYGVLSSSSSGLAKEGARIDISSIQERLASADSDKLKSVLFRKKVSTPRGQKTSATDTVSQEIIKAENGDVAVARCSAPCNSSDIFLNLDISLLLLLASIVLGYKSLVELVKKTHLFTRLSDSDWYFMATLAIRDQSLRKNVVGPKVIRDVLDSLNMNSWATPEVAPATPLRSSLSRRSGSPVMFSWIVDSSGLCLICSTKLSGQERSSILVTTFSCGHSYHSTCLAKRPYCVACRIRARKATQNKNIIATRNG